ncbi:hypothetical protein L227DRAFT_67578 [Lentinus tigrinus ALCF2SS1-6]|uniref:Uncharacterized protein n=1 Tax=Lentinus tigrinus ALCF2SS1-6 TaxID=1328759 RepID=A0A5C2SIZ8_9APHY|nr:hypothetical protein L227DRAFT_67578 [Lentinus tigrinus ALCF2SS1-6]
MWSMDGVEGAGVPLCANIQVTFNLGRDGTAKLRNRDMLAGVLSSLDCMNLWTWDAGRLLKPTSYGLASATTGGFSVRLERSQSGDVTCEQGPTTHHRPKSSSRHPRGLHKRETSDGFATRGAKVGSPCAGRARTPAMLAASANARRKVRMSVQSSRVGRRARNMWYV